jgi:hypothetical protein
MPIKPVARKTAIGGDTAKQCLERVREKYARAGRAAPTKLELYYLAVEQQVPPPTSLAGISPQRYRSPGRVPSRPSAPRPDRHSGSRWARRPSRQEGKG